MKVIKNESPLHERLKNLHWVLSHKVGVYIELGSPSGGVAFFPAKAIPDNLARCHLYVCIPIFVHIYIRALRSALHLNFGATGPRDPFTLIF